MRIALADEKATGPDALLRQGELAFRLRDYPAARRHLEAAAKERSTAEIHYKLGAARAATGDLRAALAAWELVVRLDPKNDAARDLALRTREKLGLVDGEPLPAADIQTRAQSLIAAGRAALALRMVERAAQRTAAADLGEIRAEALMALGRYVEARRALLLAASLRLASAIPYFHLAICHRRIGEPARAAYYLRLYLTLADPADPGTAARVREARRLLMSSARR